jgi:glycosyltransferase involved in cell wall biosynthesis
MTGLLVPVGDAEAMAAALTRLLEDAEGRRLLGARAREAVRERFSLERMVDQTEQIYREVLGADEATKD